MGRLKSESESGRMLYETMRPMHFEAPQTPEFQSGYDAIDWSAGPKFEPACRRCGAKAVDGRGRPLFEDGNEGKTFACAKHGGGPTKRHRARDAYFMDGSGKLL